MARARTIKPAFFKNVKLSELCAHARLLFIGLWTLVDREGRMIYCAKRIKAEIFPYEDVSVHELATALHERQFIVLYDHGGENYLWIPKFLTHQSPHPREPLGDFPKYEPSSSSEKATALHGQQSASSALPSSNPSLSLPLPRERESEFDRIRRKLK